VTVLQRFSTSLVFVAAGTTLGLMSNSNPEPAPIEPHLRRRPWTTPQLVVHESMMVLTQHFFGAPAPAMLLQVGISCVIGSGSSC
jgi:hypothetical protein